MYTVGGGATTLGGLEIPHGQQQYNIWWHHTKTEPSKFEDEITLPGPWATSEPHYHECSQPDFPR